MTQHYDVAVIGGGIVGLSHAWMAARRGLRVVLLERTAVAEGASVRNFGMIWPIGQPAGPLLDMAWRSREIWLQVLQASGLWHEQAGSLHVACHDDEAQVLREFVETNRHVRECEMLTPAQVGARCPAVRREGLRGGLWSPGEVTVDPRHVIAELPGWLQRTFGVEFHFGVRALDYDQPRLRTTAGDFTASRVVVCTGADFQELAPAAFADSGLMLCKLQMMRTSRQPGEFRIGTMLAAGLTLLHYPAFVACPTLPALARRLNAELQAYRFYGIHVLVSQNGMGEIVLGDSHEYGDAIEPFDKIDIDFLVLEYLRTFVRIPDVKIAARWQGFYVKSPTQPYVIAEPGPGMLAVTGVGGAGMTLSLGLAEQTIRRWLGEVP